MEKILVENPKLFMIIIFVVLVWTLPWKGWALWRSARRGHLGWFAVILIVNSLAILDILYIFIFSKMANDNDKQEKERDILFKKLVERDVSPQSQQKNLQKIKIV